MGTNTLVDHKAVTAKQREAWATGDFNEIARQNWIMAEGLCQAVDPYPGQEVLDVACGSGTAALVAARRYCEVTGIDYVPALIERARVRAEASGLEATFQVADAQDLPFPNGSFDAVLSVFGVQFAPDQEQAASELLRVLRPGGSIGLAGPMPGTFAGDMFATVGSYAPPPPAVDPPLRWATDDGLEALFGTAAVSIETEPQTGCAYWRSIDHALEVLTTYFGPVMRALEQLDPDEQAGLHQGLRGVLDRHNLATDGTAIIENGYLQTLVTRA